MGYRRGKRRGKRRYGKHSRRLGHYKSSRGGRRM